MNTDSRRLFIPGCSRCWGVGRTSDSGSEGRKFPTNAGMQTEMQQSTGEGNPPKALATRRRLDQGGLFTTSRTFAGAVEATREHKGANFGSAGAGASSCPVLYLGSPGSCQRVGMKLWFCWSSWSKSSMSLFLCLPNVFWNNCWPVVQAHPTRKPERFLKLLLHPSCLFSERAARPNNVRSHAAWATKPKRSVPVQLLQIASAVDVL